MASPPGSSSLFDTEADSPSAKKKLTAAKHKLLARACTDNNLGAGSVYRVLIYSIEKANSYGAFWKKNSTIAREIGIDRSTVIEAMNRLTLHGYIERIGRYNGTGNSSNVYVLTLDLPASQKAAIREARRRAKYPREQVGNSTGKPPPRCSETPTPGVVKSPHLYIPSHESFPTLTLPSLEGQKQGVQQGNGELVEGGASMGENVASGIIPPGKPSSPFPDDDTNTLGPSTSSPDEPLSSPLTADRPAGAEGPDHAQRSLGPMLVITGGLEKQAAAVSDALAPLVAAKKSAVATLGMHKFLERDLVLNRRLVFLPVDARDGVRALEYLEWANELVEVSAASGGAA